MPIMNSVHFKFLLKDLKKLAKNKDIHWWISDRHVQVENDICKFDIQLNGVFRLETGTNKYESILETIKDFGRDMEKLKRANTNIKT